jgi:hypothetical protein
VATRPPIYEDELVRRLEDLVRYADRVTTAWPSSWGVDPGERALLLRSLGDGITAFLNAGGTGRRVVTKDPRVTGLEHFRTVLPDADLLVVVRDGRSLIESGVRSFGWSYESGMRRYAVAAEHVRAFEQAHGGAGARHLVVRYEDLVGDLDGTMQRVLEAVGLDPARYDLQAAHDLPVRGSSTLRGAGADAVHWDPVARPEGFDSTRRFEGWSPYLLHRFAAIAGEAQRSLGYEVEDPLPAGPATWARDRVEDAGWRARLVRRRLMGRELPDQQ